MTHRHTLCCAILLISLLLSLPASALEGRGWMGLGVASTTPASLTRQAGLGAQLGLDLELGEFVGLQAGLDGAYHFPSSRRELSSVWVSDVFVGARYNLDVFKYVPYIGLAAVGYLNAPPAGKAQDGSSIQPGVGAKLTLGLLWRPNRQWSFGGAAEVYGVAPAVADFGLYSALTFNVGYHWRL